MENKSEILKKLALITNSLEQLKNFTQKVTLTLYLDEYNFNEVYNMFSEKKDDDYKFTIYIDNYEIIILKIV